MARYIDVTLPIENGMLAWPGDPKVELAIFKSPSKGDRSTVSSLCLGTHSGTHMDAPKHFVPGAEGVETLDPEVLIGPVMVLDLRGKLDGGHIEPRHLEPAFAAKAARIILRTGSIETMLRTGFTKEYSALSAAGAEAVVAHGVKLIGIDAMSIEPYHVPGAPTHVTLLTAKVIVIENLLLRDAPAGWYDLVALPLRIEGADGAPARVVLGKVE